MNRTIDQVELTKTYSDTYNNNVIGRGFTHPNFYYPETETQNNKQLITDLRQLANKAYGLPSDFLIQSTPRPNQNPIHVIVDFEPHGRIFWHSVRTMVATCPSEELTSDPITTTWILFEDVVRNIYDETQFSKDSGYYFGTLQTLPVFGLVTLGRYLETSRPEQAKFLRNETIKLGLALHQSLHAVKFLQPDNYLLEEIKIGYMRFRLANDILRG